MAPAPHPTDRHKPADLTPSFAHALDSRARVCVVFRFGQKLLSISTAARNAFRGFGVVCAQMNNVDGQVATTRFEGRRRYRRARMIVELTTHLIRHDDSLTHREARCLVECARKAMNSISPELCHDFNSRVAPSLEKIIVERWPCEEAQFVSANETIN